VDRLLGIGGGWKWNQYRVQRRTSESVVLKLAGSVTTLLVHEQYTYVHDCILYIDKVFVRAMKMYRGAEV